MLRLPPVNAQWLLEESASQRLQEDYPSLWHDWTKSCITCLFHTRADLGKGDSPRTFRWWDERREQVVDWECDCQAQWVLHRYLLAHGIGKGYQRLGWMDALSVPEATQVQTMEYLESWVWYVERGVNLIFYSPDAGTGKTLMLMLLAKGLLARGADMQVVQMNDLLNMHAAGWKSIEALAGFEQRIMNCTALGIDDLGKEKASSDKAIDMVNRLVDRVIRHRTANSMPTIITTNLIPEQITSGYSSYVMSLLTESCTFVPTSGADWRPRAQERMREEIQLRLCRPLVTA
jgi:DNA replication protein DnaC